VCGICPSHELLAFGCENGILECWDPRSRKQVASLDVAKDVLATLPAGSSTSHILDNNAVTALRYDNDGLGIALGTRSGHVLMYDLRSSNPLFVKDHRYDQPIVDIKFHPNRQHMITSDTKVIKIWDRRDVCGTHTHTHTHTHTLSLSLSLCTCLCV
jgi:ribosome biogenesis protein ENP2